jgi:hypothetical protein
MQFVLTTKLGNYFVESDSVQALANDIVDMDFINAVPLAGQQTADTFLRTDAILAFRVSK